MKNERIRLKPFSCLVHIREHHSHNVPCTHSTHRVYTAPALPCLTLILNSSPQLDAVSTIRALVLLLPVWSEVHKHTRHSWGRLVVPHHAVSALNSTPNDDAPLHNPAFTCPPPYCGVPYTPPVLPTPSRYAHCTTSCPQKMSLSHNFPTQQLVFHHPPPRFHPPPPSLVVPRLWGSDDHLPHGISSLDGDSYPPHAAGRAGCGRNGKQFSSLLSSRYLSLTRTSCVR